VCLAEEKCGQGSCRRAAGLVYSPSEIGLRGKAGDNRPAQGSLFLALSQKTYAPMVPLLKSRTYLPGARGSAVL
jgi:hypothetical protein